MSSKQAWKLGVQVISISLGVAYVPSSSNVLLGVKALHQLTTTSHGDDVNNGKHQRGHNCIQPYLCIGWSELQLRFLAEKAGKFVRIQRHMGKIYTVKKGCKAFAPHDQFSNLEEEEQR
jgi:hypothetical protein